MPRERGYLSTPQFYQQIEGLDADIIKGLQKLEDVDQIWLQTIGEKTKLFADTGDILPLNNFIIECKNAGRKQHKKNTMHVDDARNSLKENSIKELEKNTGKKDNDSVARPRRKAFTDANQQITETEQEESTYAKVKLERISNINDVQAAPNELAEPVNIKQEMPPPKVPLKRGRKKKEPSIKIEPRSSTRTKPRNELTKITKKSLQRDSDVILEPVNVSIISLGSDNETEIQETKKPVRTKKNKPTGSTDSEIDSNENEKLESASNKKKEIAETSDNNKSTEGFTPPPPAKSTKNKESIDSNNESSQSIKNKKKPMVLSGDEKAVKPESTRSTRTKKKQVTECDKETKTNICMDNDEMEETPPAINKKKNKKLETAKRLRSPTEESVKKTSKRTKRKLTNSIIEESEKSSDTQNGDDTIYEDAIAPPIKSSEFMNTRVMLERLPASSGMTKSEAGALEKIKSSINETILIEKIISPLHINQTVVLERENTPRNQTIANNTPRQINETVVLQKNTPLLNETVVIQKNIPILNETVVIQKPAINLNQNIADIMTDDESADEKMTPPKSSKIISKGTKPVFDLYENSPVKKKIQAFEQLTADVPIRITRTKGKAKAKPRDEVETGISSRTSSNASQIPISLKVTPSTNKHPQSISSSGKYVLGESTISTKSASTIKAAREEYRAREARRKENEEEALRKREAFKQSQIEEKKRKREEKELKAKQIREDLEKDKQLKIESLRLKEDRQKQLVLAEKLEKHQKFKEEAEKKRLLAKQRYEEKKLEEERKRVNEEKTPNGLSEAKLKEVEKLKLEARAAQAQRVLLEKKKILPIYMTKPAPLLPSYDCYDSDDPASKENRHEKPDWTRRDKLHDALSSMRFVSQTLKNTFFCLQPQSPDLSKIFQQLDPAKLKRNSSAIWKHAPRFTLMPVMDEEDL